MSEVVLFVSNSFSPKAMASRGDWRWGHGVGGGGRKEGLGVFPPLFYEARLTVCGGHRGARRRGARTCLVALLCGVSLQVGAATDTHSRVVKLVAHPTRVRLLLHRSSLHRRARRFSFAEHSDALTRTVCRCCSCVRDRCHGTQRPQTCSWPTEQPRERPSLRPQVVASQFEHAHARCLYKWPRRQILRYAPDPPC